MAILKLLLAHINIWREIWTWTEADISRPMAAEMTLSIEKKNQKR
jgi:hypothetical protein